jgi:DNA repair exonuclease SbcCD ATPase subunit
MKLDFVEVCGFRGFRDKVRIDFGTGFTVISGRNGVGKSTLFDAVEFALTGSIDKYTVEKSAKETLSDYLWWRGEGTPLAHYVTLAFIKANGDKFTVTRTRESGSDRSSEEIEAALCSDQSPEGALRQLCKTSIIRDEWIAALSVDLTETERFELVRAALGAVEGAELGAKAKEVVTGAEAIFARHEETYNALRNQIPEKLSELTVLRDTVSRSGDVAIAMQLVAMAVPNAPTELIARLAAGRAALAARRAKLGPSGEAVQQGREIELLRQKLDAPEMRLRREAVHLKLKSTEAAKSEAERIVAQAKENLVREEQADAIAASLAVLVEFGEQHGLHDEHCPLCGAMRTSQEFESGLVLARARISALESGVVAARQTLSTAKENAERASIEFASAESEWAAINQEETRLSAYEQKHVELFEQYGLDFRFVQDPVGLELEISSEHDRLIELERALLTLEASQAISMVTILEDRINSLRNDADEAADVMARSQASVVAAKEIERAIKRVSAEIIDERLAQISPLLNELYQRLRPHADWRTIDYSIRGDVRRFLSLKVGDGLNPQFVFSSGQRRAAGLAFLLSVHLARAWTSWRTLLLDDPVQHIDDFRALQLVEVLAAIRLDGRQVVCAVEDSALAELMCRRLLSTPEQVGLRYDIDIGPEGSAIVMAKVEVPPLPVGVLRRSSGLQVVG